MSSEKKSSFINVDELMPKVSVEQAVAYYSVQLPELHQIGQVVRTRCFLNCGKAQETGDRALAIKTDLPQKPWKCHERGCGKSGDLISMCDLMKPGENAGGKPRGRRFKQIVADLQAMARGVLQAKAPDSPLPSTAAQAVNPDRRLRTIQLPRAPKTTSPVPWLTSIHSLVPRGPYGNSRYPGNCGGYLIKDLLRFFQPRSVFDPMTGSGTCGDVCRELGIACQSLDIRSDFDAADPRSFVDLGTFDFVWLHPPYWRQVKYNDDPRCLSNAPSLSKFLWALRSVIRNCRRVLSPSGKLAILMGDYEDHGRQIPLTCFTKQLAIEEGLWPACIDIVRLQHGNTSSAKSYDRSFIPGLHDVCMIFKKTYNLVD